jgi:hypothetical protein
MRLRFIGALVSALVLPFAMVGSASATGVGVRINVANPDTPFPRNKSAEGAIAIDPHNPSVVAAGAFDETDEAPCGTAQSTATSPCPFVNGVGTSAVYFSFNRGKNWVQPTYSGWTAASGTPMFGPTHTVPWYFEAGLQSDGDSAVAFGPAPNPTTGQFNRATPWADGSRLYYATLTSNGGFPGETPVKGFEAVGVSRIDNPTADRITVKENWKPPVLASGKMSTTTFEDKEQVWADNAGSSPFFGNAYACFADFRGNAFFPQANEPQPLIVASSTDGGDTWTQRQITAASSSQTGGQGFGRSGCTIRTDSHGVVYVFAEQFQSNLGTLPTHGTHLMFKSFDGGNSWTRAIPLFTVTDPCYVFDSVEGRCVFDGIAGGRSDLSASPSVDIANGAPSGTGATNLIVDVWSDGGTAQNAEVTKMAWSSNGGSNWSSTTVPTPGRSFYSAPALAPDGSKVYVANTGFTTPFQTTTANPRLLVNSFLSATMTAAGPGGWATEAMGLAGDARGASANGLSAEFLGDYDYAAATTEYGVALWVADARAAQNCRAVDAYRQSLYTSSPLPKPNPAIACAESPRFGNIDIWGATTSG